MTRGPAGRGPRFSTRLLLAQSLVLVAGALTIWLVASAVGPSIFHEHLDRAGDTHSTEETQHLEEAFASAMLVSVGVALVAAVAAALAVSWYFSRRIQRSIGNVAAASSQIAAGRYDTYVDDPGLGAEFATLAATYNRLAGRLEATESTRRQMLADLAHEMRTPLATIDAHLEALEDGVRHLDSDTVTVLRSSTHRLRRLAEDIGAVSHAEEGDLRLDPRSVDATEVAATAVDAARDRYEAKGVRFDVDLHPAGRVDVDPDRIGQVLGNLIDNALRHTPAGGRVTVSCRRVDDWVEYAVADTGDGIAAEHLPHLFDRFYRVDTARDRHHGGSGIGLAIAKALIEAHRGGISATSAGPGHGSTFTVRIPAA
ncbi:MULTISPECIES: sensor histidine kinase [Nocardioides]|uniref:histidine kinase n=2 Tax=Nocardioides TaxID=1839 RepID=A0A6G7YGJ8_9ACTN|nr:MULTISPECIES: HAMP domain-containing sensor histidine kinase [Nocardioides]QIK75761.1 HAMP domain-containing histidine kinase [Nocardioides piscis]